MLLSLTAKELNFDEFKSGGLHEKHAVATGNLGTVSAFAWRQSRIKNTSVQMAGRRNYRMPTKF
jgi:hypothetical protein